MEKDISKTLHTFIKDFYSHREDLTIEITKKIKQKSNFYNIHIKVHLKPTDGLYAAINKGIDRQDLMRGLRDYLNLDWHNCMISYQVIDHSGYQYSTM